MPYKDTAKQRSYLRGYIANRRKAWIKEHGPCAWCGSWIDPEVDHIDPELKEIPTRALWNMAPTNPRRIAELAKCQVLCSQCHQRKTNLYTFSKVTHGSHTMYRNHKCKCEDCKLWAKIENAKRYKK